MRTFHIYDLQLIRFEIKDKQKCLEESEKLKTGQKVLVMIQEHMSGLGLESETFCFMDGSRLKPLIIFKKGTMQEILNT